jgi:hypothetical protein
VSNAYIRLTQPKLLSVLLVVRSYIGFGDVGLHRSEELRREFVDQHRTFLLAKALLDIGVVPQALPFGFLVQQCVRDPPLYNLRPRFSCVKTPLQAIQPR